MAADGFIMAGRRWVQRVQLQGWLGLIIAIAGLIALPILAVVSTLFVPVDLAIWQHLLVTVLPRYIINSLALMIGVGVGVIGVGVGTAWLVTLCRFPGSRWLEWALLLPLAAPAYILAYVYTDVLDFYGPVQTTLRSLFGWSRATDYWFPEVRSLGGAIVMFILVLYPYVYLITRVAFLEQSTCVIEVSRSLGCNPWRSFFTVALPLARPAIAGGTALALMETLNDFGTVQFFGVETFSTGIYRTWFGMGERIAASQLAVVLLLFILGLLLLEQWSRRRTRYYQTNNNQRALSRYELRGWRSLGAVITCVLPLLLGFVVPAALLLEMSLTNLTERFSEGFWIYARHSLILAGLTAAIGVAFSLILAYGNRLYPNWLTLLSVRVAAIGYGVPGAVIAVGILVPLGWVDNTVDQWAR